MSSATKPGDQKKQGISKKLVLKRETLAVLDVDQLNQVVGGRWNGNLPCTAWSV